jgi:hypothetical protein
MKEFLQRYGMAVIGVLSGFDRVLFRGTLRGLAFADGMMLYLSLNKIMFKDAGRHFNEISERVKAVAEQVAEAQRRPLVYLESAQTNKEKTVREIVSKERIDTGLICVLKAVEPCRTFGIQRDAQKKHQYIRCALRKCLHYYFYYMHPELELMHVRLQSWFPFTIHVCINGREWLARALDRESIAYQKSDNCFRNIADIQRAQELAQAQLSTDWPALLNDLAKQVNPLCPGLFGKYQTEYYWSAHQTEWATDVMFKSPQALAEVYPRLIRHGIQTFKSPDVMRFLGQYVTPSGQPHGNFKGEVVTDLKQRPEGVRIKHRVGGNSVKLYDKQGSVLRPETTINDARGFKVFRPKEGGPKNQKAWRYLRKGVADLHRRAQLSQACNERYLAALAKADNPQTLEESLDGICQPVRWQGRRVRALNPLGADAEIMSELGRGEYNLNGFRNRDLQAQLYSSKPKDEREARRRSGQMTRKLRLLRAHGLIKKVPKTHRYQLTGKGRTLIVAISAAKQASTKKLTEFAA